jgi:predicted HTH domain antitoxin
MSLTVTLNLPPDVEEKLRQGTSDLDNDVKEAYALELFRRGKLSHYELSRVLELDRFETDSFLKRHNVFEGSLTLEDLEADLNSLRDLFSKKR